MDDVHPVLPKKAVQLRQRAGLRQRIVRGGEPPKGGQAKDTLLPGGRMGMLRGDHRDSMPQQFQLAPKGTHGHRHPVGDWWIRLGEDGDMHRVLPLSSPRLLRLLPRLEEGDDVGQAEAPLVAGGAIMVQ